MADASHHPPARFCPKFLAFCALPLACASSATKARELTAPPELAVTRRIEQFLEEKDEVGFSYLVVSKAGPVFELHRGRLDAAFETPVTAEAMFQSASTTKVITTIAILRLVDRGRLRLDDPLSSSFPDHPYGREVTIRSLLNHSSGIPNPLPLTWVHTRAEHPSFEEGKALTTALQENAQLRAEPGARYLYSNLGYWLLGALIERISDKKYSSFVEEEVFGPLGITPSEINFEGRDASHEARGHYKRSSLLGLAMPFLTDRTIRAPKSGSWGRFESLFMNGPAYGGAFATARGYGKLLTDLLSERSSVLSDSSRAALFSPQVDRTGRPLGVTLAFRTGDLGGTPYFSKPGGGPGFSSNLRIYRERGLATVFLSNRMRVSEAEIQRISDELDRPFLAQ